jgi:hypothetical protein
MTERVCNMVKFIPVKCQDYKYPSDINPQIQERSANFFRKNIKKTNLHLSLHTDPPKTWSGKQREIILASEFLKEFPAILKNMLDSGHSCVSKLWCDDKKWSKDFADFLVRLTEGIEPQRIKIIEIHPPFATYCNSLEIFIERYKTFEAEISKNFPSAIICIENRCNTPHNSKYGKFILSTNKDIIKFANLISMSSLKLKLVVDVPQLFSEHEQLENRLISEEGMIEQVLTPLRDIRDFIASTHIWGKTDKKPHNADLNIYFSKNQSVKNRFLQEICKLFDDGKARYFLPEVLSPNDEMSVEESIESIVNDLRKIGIKFVDPCV